MPEHPSTDGRGEEPIEELRPDAPVFAVGPVRRRTRVPRVALVGIVVGVLAFVAGIGVASAGPTVRPVPAGPPPRASANLAASPAAPPTESAAGLDATPNPVATAAGPDAAVASPPSSLAIAGTSAFATAFRPDAIIAATKGGAACVSGEPREKEVPRTRRDGPRLTFQRSWLIWCPVPQKRRQAFLLAALQAFVNDIPAATYGYSATLDGAGDALYPYAEPPLSGTVAVTADAAGNGFSIAVVLEEWLADQAR